MNADPLHAPPLGAQEKGSRRVGDTEFIKIQPSLQVVFRRAGKAAGHRLAKQRQGLVSEGKE
ncbi:hypothetical protein GCM10023095_04480 [Pseudaeromonas paramecii]|uniref:Uncharacterized protein n=1 Tax=Pseudaeromonas paramecii TaxID=2138166 RepID=A0ABP8PXW9_9GAMM